MKNTLYYRLDMKRQKNREKDEAGKPAKLTVLQLSWLERYTDNVEVGSSTLPGPTNQVIGKVWGYSSVGRAPALQAGGQEFESLYLHIKRLTGSDMNPESQTKTFGVHCLDWPAVVFWYNGHLTHVILLFVLQVTTFLV